MCDEDLNRVLTSVIAKEGDVCLRRNGLFTNSPLAWSWAPRGVSHVVGGHGVVAWPLNLSDCHDDRGSMLLFTHPKDE